MLEMSCPHCKGKFNIEIIGVEKRTKAPKPIKNPDVPLLLKYFYDKWKQKFGKLYVANFGMEGKLAKQMLSAYSLDQLKELVDKYFAMEDEFVKNQGYKFTIFKTQINVLLSRKETPDERRKRIEGLHKQFGV